MELLLAAVATSLIGALVSLYLARRPGRRRGTRPVGAAPVTGGGAPSGGTTRADTASDVAGPAADQADHTRAAQREAQHRHALDSDRAREAAQRDQRRSPGERHASSVTAHSAAPTHPSVEAAVLAMRIEHLEGDLKDLEDRLAELERRTLGPWDVATTIFTIVGALGGVVGIIAWIVDSIG